jgi:parallel beta-helix repeat protein
VNTQTRVLRNTIAGSGYQAIDGYMNKNTLIQGNTIYGNNLSGFDSVNWAGAGVKIATFTNLVIDNNLVHNNAGPGLWCDISCANVTISNNRVHDNSGVGIFFEISTDAKIFGNAVWNTGPDADAISVSSSANVAVYGNVLAWNRVGITVISQDRDGRPRQGTVGIGVHDNAVLARSAASVGLQWRQFGRGNLLDPQSGNYGASNRFWYPVAEDGYVRFRWQRPFDSLDGFSSTPGGTGARYLARAECDELVAEWGIATGC